MIIPNKLKKGDTVLVVEASASIEEKDKEYIEKSTKMLEDLGLNVEFAKNVYSNKTGYGATVLEKAEDINEGFRNSKYQMLFLVKGGANSNSLFDYLDYEVIANNPKIICGFSDSTSITNMITEKTGLVTYSGPTFKSLSSWETEYSYRSFIKRFMEEDLELSEQDDEFITIKAGKTVGELIGGNLSLISKMVAGKYKLNFENKILFIEELGFESEPAMCSGNLYYLKQNGVFDKIKGIWVGNYEHEDNIQLEQILLDTIGDEYNFPIIKSNNFGHTDRKTVIPIGTIAKIDTNSQEKIELLEKCVK
ncbi:MAG: LD-carboxypeptidase [Clostridia bacterium]|nr:LD-carboxypeptidase [Clostridia bacterium]